SIPCETVDGTDALLTYEAIRLAVERARSGGGPQAVEAVTLRIHGHAAHDDGSYVPQELRDEYAARDPVARLLGRLVADGMTDDEPDEVRAGAAGLAEGERSPAPAPATLEEGVWAAPPRATVVP